MFFILVCVEKERFQSLETFLREHDDVEVLTVSSASDALQVLAARPVDVAVVDEQLGEVSGLAFIAQLVRHNPFLNCALVSELAADDFHEVTEGYGVFMQLPPQPARQDGQQLLENCRRITRMLGETGTHKVTP